MGFEILGTPQISKTCSVENMLFDKNTPMSTQLHNLLGIPITNALQRVKLRNSKYAIDLNSNEIRTRHITSQLDVLDQYVS